MLGLATWLILLAVDAAFGSLVSNWLASVVLAFCLGALWGTGNEARRAKSAGIDVREV